MIFDGSALFHAHVDHLFICIQCDSIRLSMMIQAVNAVAHRSKELGEPVKVHHRCREAEEVGAAYKENHLVCLRAPPQ